MQYPTKYGVNVSVEIVRDIQNDIATVHVYAPLYIRKHWIMSHSYKSSEFSDYAILNDSDFISIMSKHY